MTFIKLNGSVYDYREYLRKIILLKNYLRIALSEILDMNNFERTDKKGLVFYNKDMDIELEINIRKKHKEEFV
ncbi:MAG: hypothetical protein ABIE94_02535 [archaeon]